MSQGILNPPEEGVSFSKKMIVDLLNEMKNEIIGKFSHKKTNSNAENFIQEQILENPSFESENNKSHLRFTKNDLKSMLDKYGGHLKHTISNEKKDVQNQEMEYYKNYIQLNNLMWYYYHYDVERYKKLLDEYSNRLHNQLLSNLGLPPVLSPKPKIETKLPSPKPKNNGPFVPQYNVHAKGESDSRNYLPEITHNSEITMKTEPSQKNLRMSDTVEIIPPLNRRRSNVSSQITSHYLPNPSNSHLHSQNNVHRKSKSYQSSELMNHLSTRSIGEKEEYQLKPIMSKKNVSEYPLQSQILDQEKISDKTPYLRKNKKEAFDSLAPTSLELLENRKNSKVKPISMAKILETEEDNSNYNKTQKNIKKNKGFHLDLSPPKYEENAYQKSHKKFELLEENAPSSQSKPHLKKKEFYFNVKNQKQADPLSIKSLAMIDDINSPKLENQNKINANIRPNAIKLPAIHVKTPNGHSKKPNLQKNSLLE